MSFPCELTYYLYQAVTDRLKRQLNAYRLFAHCESFKKLRTYSYCCLPVGQIYSNTN